MTVQEYRTICNALMCNHHERLLAEATKRNDANAVAQETATLSNIKNNISGENGGIKNESCN